MGQLNPDSSSLKILGLVHVLSIDKKDLSSSLCISSGISVEDSRTAGKNDHLNGAEVEETLLLYYFIISWI